MVGGSGSKVLKVVKVVRVLNFSGAGKSNIFTWAFTFAGIVGSLRPQIQRPAAVRFSVMAMSSALGIPVPVTRDY